MARSAALRDVRHRLLLAPSAFMT